MKIKIEINENLEENEVIIRCKQLDESIQKLQQSISNNSSSTKFVFYKDDIEYYLPLNSILFFETNGNAVEAHTEDSIYNIKYRLYELEELLPYNFIRVSKSTILNVNHVYSIDKNITSSSLIKFYKSHKQVYVSRNYYKILEQKLAERRNYEK